MHILKMRGVSEGDYDFIRKRRNRKKGLWFENLILSPNMKNKVQAVSDTKVDELPTEDKVIDTVNKYRRAS